jgi:hypothetical protein
LCVPARLLRESILREHHDAPIAGHPGIKKTYKKIKEDYYWSGMKKEMKTYITKCDACQKNKNRTQKPQGFLEPLPIPEQNWKDLAQDFTTNLPKTG